MAAVDLQGVTKSYDGKAIVIHGIDLDIRHGEFVVFVGPSGCGKSTLLRMIAGLEPISSGEVRIEGRRVNELPPRHRDIAMVFQDYALYPHKTLFDNMAFGLRLRKTPEAEIQRRVMDAARLLRIDHLLDRRPAALSGGQRQRVAIGRAIVREPKVFLFDEPLSNLDAQLRNEMRSEIKRLHQRLGATIIYVTHDQTEAMTLGDRVAVMRAGTIQQVASPKELYAHPTNLFVAGFIGSPSMNFLPFEGEALAGSESIAFAGSKTALPKLEEAATGKLVLGVRPEHVTLSDAAPLKGKIEATEYLGTTQIITLSTPHGTVKVRAPAAQMARVGDLTGLALTTARLSLFDATSGRALRTAANAGVFHG